MSTTNRSKGRQQEMFAWIESQQEKKVNEYHGDVIS